MTSDPDDLTMKAYYRERAPVYDRVYQYPERQADLRFLEELVATTFRGLSVLEVAAGTGYWTPHIARAAQSILATDATADALAQIAERPLKAPVETKIVDAYALSDLGQTFQAGFAGCWFSHVPVARQTEWLNQMHACLEPGAKVMLLDNGPAQCERFPLVDEDDDGNTYQERVTDAGKRYRVLKNFPTQATFASLLGDSAASFEYRALDHYWYVTYQYRGS